MQVEQMGRISRIALLGLCLVQLACAGCVSKGLWLREVERSVRVNQPQAALSQLESRDIQASDPALYLLHKGYLQRMLGDIEGSIASFEAAKELVTFQEATSISELASNLTLSEGSGNYQPPAFEQLQLHFFQALNRLDLGDWEAARVEAMQIDILLERRWQGSAPLGGDASARYLTGLIFEGNGESDNALVAYRKAYQAYQQNPTVSVPVDLKQRLLYLTRQLGLQGEHDALVQEFGPGLVTATDQLEQEYAQAGSELVVIAATGMVPFRYENSVVEQDPLSGRIYRLSLPALSANGDAIGSLELHADEKAVVSQPLEDLSAVAQRTLSDELPGLLAKAIARNVAKNAVANQVAEEDAFAGLLVNFLSAATESADVRSWSTLPARIQLLRMPVNPGEYENLMVEYYTAQGAHLRRESLGTVEVSQGKPTVVGIHLSGT